MSILQRISNFNLICAAFSHSLEGPQPWLSTNGKGQVGTKRKCKRCTKEVKVYNTPEIQEYPKIS